MKKFLSITAFFICLAGVNAAAQDDIMKAVTAAATAENDAPQAKKEKVRSEFWKRGVTMDLGFNQTGLAHWIAGGYNTLTLNVGMDAQANYSKDMMSWSNRAQLNYGFLWAADKPNLLQKSMDRIYIESVWAYRTGANSKWNYTASFDFRTQFSGSYDSYKQNQETHKWEGTLKSSIFSPAYTNIALGMEWKPVNWFNVNIAPMTGSLNICTVPELRKTYGMNLIPGSENEYSPCLFQLGAQVKANLKLTLNDILNYETQLVVFTDYLYKPFTFYRVNWDNKLSWQAAKFFKIGIDTWLIYDPIIVGKGETESKVQFKEFLSINFTYTFGDEINKKKK